MAIPKGTLLAILITGIVYLGVAVSTGAPIFLSTASVYQPFFSGFNDGVVCLHLQVRAS